MDQDYSILLPTPPTLDADQTLLRSVLADKIGHALGHETGLNWWVPPDEITFSDHTATLYPPPAVSPYPAGWKVYRAVWTAPI